MSTLKELLQKGDKENNLLKKEASFQEFEELEENIESEFWGIERILSRMALMLDLRLKGGRFLALPYSYMTKIQFDPSEALEIFVSDLHIKIRGRNLHKLYSYLLRHKVTFIQESLTSNDLIDETETFVREITVAQVM